VRCVQTLASWNLLRWSYHIILCGHTCCYCSQLCCIPQYCSCCYYGLLLYFFADLIVYMILLHLSIIYNLKSSPCRKIATFHNQICKYIHNLPMCQILYSQAQSINIKYYDCNCYFL
jgi:hypothetical protein